MWECCQWSMLPVGRSGAAVARERDPPWGVAWCGTGGAQLVATESAVAVNCDPPACGMERIWVRSGSRGRGRRSNSRCGGRSYRASSPARAPPDTENGRVNHLSSSGSSANADRRDANANPPASNFEYLAIYRAVLYHASPFLPTGSRRAHLCISPSPLCNENNLNNRKTTYHWRAG